MSDLEKIAEFFVRENAKAKAERDALKHLVTILIARRAKEKDNSEKYIMTLIAGVVSGFDATAPEDELVNLAFKHGASYCSEIETDALSRLNDSFPLS